MLQWEQQQWCRNSKKKLVFSINVNTEISHMWHNGIWSNVKYEKTESHPKRPGKNIDNMQLSSGLYYHKSYQVLLGSEKELWMYAWAFLPGWNRKACLIILTVTISSMSTSCISYIFWPQVDMCQSCDLYNKWEERDVESKDALMTLIPCHQCTCQLWDHVTLHTS